MKEVTLPQTKDIGQDDAIVHNAINLLMDLMARAPFHKVLGIPPESLNVEKRTVTVNMRDNLLGNFVAGGAHGGAMSTLMDLEGVFVLCLDTINQMRGEPSEKIFERLFKITTTSLRIDYLQLCKGNHFTASGHLLRSGNKIAVVRLELHNDQQKLLAVGTASYLTA